jgi:hypothetical protein
VNVRSPQEVEQTLSAIWHKLQTALQSADINAALTYITPSRRDGYGRLFRQADGSTLRQRAAAIDGPLHLDAFRGSVAILSRDANLDGQTLRLSVEFVSGSDGVWRVRFF